MPVPIWVGRYIGLPFSERGRDRRGLDCWGLVRLVMGEQFGLLLPNFFQDYRRVTDTEAISRLIIREAQSWQKITPGEEVLGDVIVLRMRGQPMHVGLVVGDGQMLHIESGVNSSLERYTGLRWQARFSGFYRYRTDGDEHVSLS